MSEWEKVNYSPVSYTDRMKVPDGWIVKVLESDGQENFSIAVTYVPDPHHRWKL